MNSYYSNIIQIIFEYRIIRSPLNQQPKQHNGQKAMQSKQRQFFIPHVSKTIHDVDAQLQNKKSVFDINWDFFQISAALPH